MLFFREGDDMCACGKRAPRFVKANVPVMP